MDKVLKRTIQVTLSLGAIVGLVGCSEMPSTGDTADEQAGEALSGVNGLSVIQGLSVNGLSANGLSVNGLSVNGLSSTNGLMTTGMGRRTVSYLVKCALGSGQSLVKADQTGTNYTYPGAFGLASDWYSGSPSTAEQEAVSACMMAHVNVAGVASGFPARSTLRTWKV